MKRKTIELMEFDGDTTSLYNNPAYDTRFVIETADGDVHTVALLLSGSKHRFTGETITVDATSVAYIEDRIWNHIK